MLQKRPARPKIGSNNPELAFPKGRTKRQDKDRLARREAAAVKSVRAQCMDRELSRCRFEVTPATWGYDVFSPGMWLECEGPLEWAHAPWWTRAKTRGMAPEVRHTTADSLIVCQRHHDQIDGRRRPRIGMAKTSTAGCDGRLIFTLDTQ